MQLIKLKAIPNQQFTIQLDGNYYDITLKATSEIMAATIIRDNEILVTGTRVVAGTPLLNYKYLENGNFFIVTNGGDLPHYTKFGVTQNMIFITQAELNSLRTFI